MLSGKYRMEEGKRYCPDVVKIFPGRKKSSKIEFRDRSRQVEKKIIMIL